MQFENIQSHIIEMLQCLRQQRIRETDTTEFDYCIAALERFQVFLVQRGFAAEKQDPCIAYGFIDCKCLWCTALTPWIGCVAIRGAYDSRHMNEMCVVCLDSYDLVMINGCSKGRVMCCRCATHWWRKCMDSGNIPGCPHCRQFFTIPPGPEAVIAAKKIRDKVLPLFLELQLDANQIISLARGQASAIYQTIPTTN